MRGSGGTECSPYPSRPDFHQFSPVITFLAPGRQMQTLLLARMPAPLSGERVQSACAEHITHLFCNNMQYLARSLLGIILGT
jgi:hypothetical protein